MLRSVSLSALLVAALVVTACGGETKAAPATRTPPPATPGVATPDPGRQVITVEMITDGDGNYFKPAEITVRRGDVIRWTLVSGVHNVSFPHERNPGIAGDVLPASSPFLQLPGQTWDIKITFAPGSYGYHCDPHAALGMIGKITVTEE